MPFLLPIDSAQEAQLSLPCSPGLFLSDSFVVLDRSHPKGVEQ